MIHALNMVWNPSEGIDLGFFLLRFYSLSWVLAFGLGWYVMKPIFIFVKNDKNNIEDCGSHAWTLKHVLENKKDLQNLIIDLDKIRQSVKNNIKEKDIIDLYYKYERYLI